MAIREKYTGPTQGGDTLSTAPAPKASSSVLRAGSPIVGAFLAFRDALKAVVDSSTPENDGTSVAGEVLGALVKAGGRLPNLDDHTLRFFFQPRDVSQVAHDPDCNRLAGNLAAYLGGALGAGAKSKSDGDAHLPAHEVLVGVLSKSKTWNDAAGELDTLKAAEGAARAKALEEAHWARLEAAKKAGQNPSPVVPHPISAPKAEDDVPVS